MTITAVVRVGTILAALMVLGTTVHARNYQPVDCDTGDTIQEALDQRNYNEKQLIEISGTCEEDVLITTDGSSFEINPANGNRQTFEAR